MFKYFTAKGTRKDIDVLDDIVDSYNNTTHRDTKYKPALFNTENEFEVSYNTYGNSVRNMQNIKENPSIKINNIVRRKYKRKAFDKGYYPNWTDKTYHIKQVVSNEYPMYNVNGINQKFYKHNMQAVNENKFRIEKIADRRVRNKKIEYLLKWLGYADSENTWEQQQSIEKL